MGKHLPIPITLDAILGSLFGVSTKTPNIYSSVGGFLVVHFLGHSIETELGQQGRGCAAHRHLPFKRKSYTMSPFEAAAGVYLASP